MLKYMLKYFNNNVISSDCQMIVDVRGLLLEHWRYVFHVNIDQTLKGWRGAVGCTPD